MKYRHLNRTLLWIMFFFLVVFFFTYPLRQVSESLQFESDLPIDIVYTWVNGSDPNFINQMKLYANQQIIEMNRYVDKNELKYSMRSLEKYAPWIRNIYVVTNGQTPTWLNLMHPKIRLISHEQIFPNKSHLPTFSSPAIETHLHRIESISSRFIYFNDDIFLNAPVYLHDFYTPQNGFKIRLSWPLSPYSEALNSYDASLLYVNRLLDETYGMDEEGQRKKIAHVPHMIDVEIMRAFEAKFASHLDRTSSSRFRRVDNIQYAFAYDYFLMSERQWPYEVDETDQTWYFFSLGGDEYWSWNNNPFPFYWYRNQFSRLPHKKFVCINDDIDYSGDEEKANELMQRANQILESLFPLKSSFEI